MQPAQGLHDDTGLRRAKAEIYNFFRQLDHQLTFTAILSMQQVNAIGGISHGKMVPARRILEVMNRGIALPGE